MLEEIKYDHDTGNDEQSDSDSNSSSSSSSSSTPTTTAISDDNARRSPITVPGYSNITARNNATFNYNKSITTNNVADNEDEESNEDTDDSESRTGSEDSTAGDDIDEVDRPTGTAAAASAVLGAGKSPEAKSQAARLLAKLDHHVDSVVVRKKARDRTISQGELYTEIERLVTASDDITENDATTEQPPPDEVDSINSIGATEAKEIVLATDSSQVNEEAIKGTETDIEESEDDHKVKEVNNKVKEDGNKNKIVNTELTDGVDDNNDERFTEIVLGDVQVSDSSSSRAFQWCCCVRSRKTS